MYANLIAFNAIEGKTSSGSVEFSGNQNDIIQLNIGTHKWFFDHTGNMLSSTENQSCSTILIKGSCAQPPTQNVCYPVINSNSDNDIPNPKFTPYD